MKCCQLFGSGWDWCFIWLRVHKYNNYITVLRLKCSFPSLIPELGYWRFCSSNLLVSSDSSKMELTFCFRLARRHAPACLVQNPCPKIEGDQVSCTKVGGFSFVDAKQKYNSCVHIFPLLLRCFGCMTEHQ